MYPNWPILACTCRTDFGMSARPAVPRSSLVNDPIRYNALSGRDVMEIGIVSDL